MANQQKDNSNPKHSGKKSHKVNCPAHDDKYTGLVIVGDDIARIYASLDIKIKDYFFSRKTKGTSRD